MTHNSIHLAALKGASVPRAERIAAVEAARKSKTNVAVAPIDPATLAAVGVPRANYFIEQEDDGDYGFPFLNEQGH